MARPPRPHEHAYYSSGQWFIPQLYVVGWQHLPALKIGITNIGRKRFGMYLNRGGDMLALHTLPALENLRVEQESEEEIARIWPPAFETKDEATPWLGRRGAGWTECYRIPVLEWHRALEIVKEKL